MGIVPPIAARSTWIPAVGTLLVGLACCWPAFGLGAAEPRGGPRASQVMLGYNRAHGFFYGEAQMPRKTDGSGEFACLMGNRHFPDGPRLLRIYRVLPDGDRAISPDVPAGANAENGILVWKFERKHVSAGRYYVVFEQKQPSGPYRPSECPEFRSSAVWLPKPRPVPPPHDGDARRSPRSG